MWGGEEADNPWQTLWLKNEWRRKDMNGMVDYENLGGKGTARHGRAGHGLC